MTTLANGKTALTSSDEDLEALLDATEPTTMSVSENYLAAAQEHSNTLHKSTFFTTE